MARIFTAFTEKSQRPFEGVGEALTGYAAFQLKQKELQQQQQRFREEIGLRQQQLKLQGDQLEATIQMNKDLRSLQREQLDKTLKSRERIAQDELALGQAGLIEKRRANLAAEQEGRAKRAQDARLTEETLRSAEKRTETTAEATVRAAEIRVGGAQAQAAQEAEAAQAQLDGRRSAALVGLERRADLLMRANDNKPIELRMPQSEYTDYKTALEGLAIAYEAATTEKEFEDLQRQEAALFKAIEDGMKASAEARATAMTVNRRDRMAVEAVAAGVPQGDVDEVLGNGSLSDTERADILALRRNGARALQEAEVLQGQLMVSGTADGDMYNSLLRSAEQIHTKEIKQKGSGLRDLDAVVASQQPGTPGFSAAIRKREFSRAYEEYHGAQTQQQQADALRKMMSIARMDEPTMGLLANQERQAMSARQEAQNSQVTMEYERAALQQLPPGVSVGLSDPATQLAIAYMQEAGNYWAAGKDYGKLRVEGWSDEMTEFAANLEEAVLLYDQLPAMTGDQTGPGAGGQRPEGFRTTFDYQISYLRENGMTPEDFATLAVTVHNLLALPPNSHFKKWAAQVSERPE